MAAVNLHATAIRLDDVGLLIRGASGAGKSLLALELIDDHGAVLVADDRVDVSAEGGQVVMRCPAQIFGRIELRGRGIVHRVATASAELSLVIDLVETLERMPERSAFVTELLGMRLPRCPIPRRGVVDSAHQVLLLRAAMSALVHPDGDEFA